MRVKRYVRREIAHGARIPRGWRIAWYEPKRRVGVYSPAPIHWILRVGREAVHRIRQAITAPSIERAEAVEMERQHRERQRLAEEYSRGYLTGWRECVDACLAAVEDEFVTSNDLWEIGDLLSGSVRQRTSGRRGETRG